MKKQTGNQIELSAEQREALTKESIGLITLDEAQLELVAGGMMKVTKKTKGFDGGDDFECLS